MKRFLLATLFVAGLAIPSLTHAQLDQKCWVKDDCIRQRKVITNNTLNDQEATQGFVQSSETETACGGTKWGNKDVGFCLPAGQADTKISFGGQNRFENIGTFIQSMYQYVILIAGILATAMLVVAGFQWAASGGNSDAISSAKNRIAGAISGLIILALSYIILNTVNPYLVNFRLPKIWLINGQGLAEYCSALSESDKIEYVGSGAEKIPESVRVAKFKDGQFSLNPAQAECGKQYIFSSGGGQICRGTACQPGNVCLRGLESTDEGCFVGNIGGTISNSSLADSVINNADSWIADLIADGVTDFWEFPWVPDAGILDNIRLLYVCQNGTVHDVDSSYTLQSSIKTAKQIYTLSVSESNLANATNNCGENGGFKGFALRVDFNNPNDVVEDEAHVIGRTPSGGAIDLGDMGTFKHFGHYDYDIPTPINKATSPESYMTKEQIMAGVNLNIDSARICPIFDDQKDRVKCYGVTAAK